MLHVSLASFEAWQLPHSFQALHRRASLPLITKCMVTQHVQSISAPFAEHCVIRDMEIAFLSLREAFLENQTVFLLRIHCLALPAVRNIRAAWWFHVAVSTCGNAEGFDLQVLQTFFYCVRGWTVRRIDPQESVCPQMPWHCFIEV